MIKAIHILLFLFFTLIISAHSANPVLKATICAKSGACIYDEQLAGWIQNIIDPAAKRLIVLTECYGGNAVDNFAGEANTAVASATSPGEQAEYGAYDAAAAGALKPGAGRTAQNVQDAGTANKAKDGTENPSSGGGLALRDFSLEDASADGNIQSRHILIYAGKPSRKGYDTNLREKIRNNFAGQANTTIKTVGGEGTSQGWDNPGTAKGLRDALIDIGISILNAPDPSKEQFILFITDHGDLHCVETVNEKVHDGGCVTVSNFPTFTAHDINPVQIEAPGFSAFIPFADGLIHPVADNYQAFFQPSQWLLHLGTNTEFENPLVLTNFTELYEEFNNNIIGDLDGEGVTLFFPMERGLFTNSFMNTNTNLRLINLSGAEYTVGTISQDSGEVAKGTFDETVYIPLAADFDGDGLADPAKYLETNGTWQIMLSASGYAITSITLGDTDYAPLAGDFDGDGLADPGIYEKSTGAWQVLLSGGAYQSISFNLGDEASRPVAGDFDGDGLADPAVYLPSTGSWIIKLSSAGYAPLTLTSFLGGSSYTPLAGDFDGDGKADPAVYQAGSGTWVIKFSGTGYAPTCLTNFLGSSGYTPVAADFDGDGLADPTVYNLTSSTWRLLLSSSGYAPMTITF
jgi:hypothetical protein